MFFLYHSISSTLTHFFSLHDALPISYTHLTMVAENATGLRNMFKLSSLASFEGQLGKWSRMDAEIIAEDRKSTRLNSSHVAISYAVLYLKKKKNRRTCRSE